jgi:hypothetical protein
MSDGTHLMNFVADKNEWPGYMTIGNLSSNICQMPSIHSVIMVALQPIPIKNAKIPQKWLDVQPQTNQEVLNYVRRRLLQHLTSKQIPSAESGYCNVHCANGNFGRCQPDIAVWLADCTEYSDLQHLEWDVCLWCKCPENTLGDYDPPDKEHPCWDHNIY